MKFLLAILCTAWSLLPLPALACACGCGVFDVGGNVMVATQPGLEGFIEEDYMDQTQNWSGRSSAPAQNNTDREIRTNFVTLGVQDMITHDWGVMVEVPVWNRVFRTTSNGPLETFDHTALGDIRLLGVYTGFSHDGSTGLIAGVRLPTGDWRYPNFDRDVEIGSGSTDVMLGAYHFGAIGRTEHWTYLVQAMTDLPVSGQGGYHPGDEIDASAAITYQGWTVGRVQIEPLLQVIASARASDRGPAADPDNSGYQRLILSPGLQASIDRWRLYGDVEFPVYQNVRGNQLIAPELFKLVLSRNF